MNAIAYATRALENLEAQGRMFDELAVTFTDEDHRREARADSNRVWAQCARMRIHIRSTVAKLDVYYPEPQPAFDPDHPYATC